MNRGPLAGLDQAIMISAGVAISGTLVVGLFAVSRVTRRLHHSAAVAHRINEDRLEISRLDSDTERADLAAHDLGELARQTVRSSSYTTSA